uniref:Proline transport helper PTH2 n=1 Tax=Candida albicans TaxID=5476 RepID=Q9Y7F9_CANAX|nr:proline transport helper PTH2 [Candida albicans]
MKRWTDGRLWSASKVYNGNFLVYKQLNKKTKREQEEEESGGQALVKQSFSVVTKDHQRFHLISYYENVPGSFRPKSASNQTITTVNIPSHDSKFNQLDLSNAIYPDSLLNSIYKRKHQQQQE